MHSISLLLRRSLPLPPSLLNKSPFLHSRRFHALIYTETGDASKVLKLVQTLPHSYTIPSTPSTSLLTSDETITVEPLLTSLNTADMNTISGTYPTKPSFTTDPSKKYAIAGSEFVGVVAKNSRHNTSSMMTVGFEPGSIVIPRSVAIGSLQSSLPSLPTRHFLSANSFHKMDDDGDGDKAKYLSDLLAMQVNPSTAYQILATSHPAFPYLPPQPRPPSANNAAAPSTIFGTDDSRVPNEYILISCGLSAVSTVLSLLSSQKYNMNPVLILRRGPRTPEEFEEICVNVLKNNFNAAIVFEEEKFQRMSPRQIENVISKHQDDAVKDHFERLGYTYTLTTPLEKQEYTIPLAVDCVGGKTSSTMLSCLTHGGKHITYGCLSMEPFKVRAGGVIFKDLKVEGFWLTSYLYAEERRFQALEQEVLMDAATGGGGCGSVSVDCMSEDRVKMLNELGGLVKRGRLKMPDIEKYQLKEVGKGVERVGKGKKIAMICCEGEDKDEEGGVDEMVKEWRRAARRL